MISGRCFWRSLDISSVESSFWTMIGLLSFHLVNSSRMAASDFPETSFFTDFVRVSFMDGLATSLENAFF